MSERIRKHNPQYHQNSQAGKTLEKSSTVEDFSQQPTFGSKEDEDFWTSDDYLTLSRANEKAAVEQTNSSGEKAQAKANQQQHQPLSEEQIAALSGNLRQILDFFKPLGEFVSGSVYQWLYNNGESARWLLRLLVPGWNGLEEDVEKSLPQSFWFEAGRTLGDGASVVQGILEIVGGTGAQVGGGALCITGIGCLGGAPAIAAGVVLQVHGAGTASSGLANIIERLGIVFHSSNTPEGDSSNNAPDAEVVTQKDVDTNVTVGSGEPWTGSNEPPQWGNPKSKKAYGHSVNDHGAKNKPTRMQDRAENKGAQGQWYDDADIVLAEQVAPRHPGKYLIDFKRSIGRVFVRGQGKDNPTEGVTRFYLQRKPDGTLETTYPVSENFTLSQ